MESGNELSDDEAFSTKESVPSQNKIVNLDCLESLLASACVCARCKSGSMTTSEKEHIGLASVVQLKCDSRGQVFHGPLAIRHPPSRFYDINRRSAVAMRAIGKGRQALRKICAVTDLPEPLHKNSYAAHWNALRKVAAKVAKESMQICGADLLRMRREEKEDNPSQIAVSTDGTWMRRGYSSLFGVQTVISHDTQKVIGVEVLSRHCKQCEFWGAKVQRKKVTVAEFEEWKLGHADDCQRNTEVSAPTMETEGVKILWSNLCRPTTSSTPPT